MYYNTKAVWTCTWEGWVNLWSWSSARLGQRNCECSSVCLLRHLDYLWQPGVSPQVQKHERVSPSMDSHQGQSQRATFLDSTTVFSKPWHVLAQQVSCHLSLSTDSFRTDFCKKSEYLRLVRGFISVPVGCRIVFQLRAGIQFWSRACTGIQGCLQLLVFSFLYFFFPQYFILLATHY